MVGDSFMTSRSQVINLWSNFNEEVDSGHSSFFYFYGGGRTLLMSSIANPRFPVHSRGQRARIDIRQKTFR